MKKISVFDIVIEVIGFENALKLIEECGGLTFYIPKITNKELEIITTIINMKSKNYTKRQIIELLKNNLMLSNRVIKKYIDKFF